MGTFEMNRNKMETSKSRKRKAQVEAGLFDGRFKTRIIEDKKKKASKDACRGQITDK